MARYRSDLTVMIQSHDIKELFADFKAHHDEKGYGAADNIETNDVAFQALRDKWLAFYKSYSESLGFYDFFLICKSHGHVLFSVAGESDLGENLSAGELKNSNLARLWQKVIKSGQVELVDFDSYAPSNGAQAAFIGGPVKDEAGEMVAMAVLQIPHNQIQDIVGYREGMGQSGETYLGAIDPQSGGIEFRTNMETMGDGKYVVGYDLTQKAPQYIKEVLAGNDVADLFLDSSGKPVFVVANPLAVNGVNWAIVSKVDVVETFASKQAGESKDFLTRYKEQYGYYDLFLIAENGNIFYSVEQEPDFGTNIINGQFKDSNLGQLIRDITTTKTFGFADFAPYAPSNDQPASFIAQPLIHDQKTKLFVALQLPLDSINKLMQIRSGMGDTGESYLVGPDKRMRSDSFLDKTGRSVTASFAGNLKDNGVDTTAVTEALNGTTRAQIITDYNGNRVLSSYTPLKTPAGTWALIAEVDESEAYKDLKTLEILLIILSLSFLLIIIITALFFGKAITKPVQKIIASLSNGASEVRSASNQVAESGQSLAEAANEQAASLEQISASIEELSAMVNQNSDNSTRVNSLSEHTLEATGRGNQTVTEMNGAMETIKESSDETAKIIKTIDEIAFQTNLLALNAAVEAARAGEAGKGFAVVAEEVRNLAQRCAEAAKETSRLIEGVQTKADNGVNVSKSVAGIFDEILDGSRQVAELVKEVTLASHEQTQGISQINQAVSQLDQVTQANASNSEEAAATGEELSAQAHEMARVVESLRVLIQGGHDSHQETNSYVVQATAYKQQVNAQPARPSARQEAPVRSPKKEICIPLDDDDFDDF